MKSFLTILAVLVHQMALAQTEVNIEAHLLDHLEKYIPADIENEVDSALWQKKLTDLQWEIVAGSTRIAVDNDNQTQEPVRAISQVYENVNCSQVTRSWNENFSLSVNRFSSINYSKTVSSSKAEESSVELKFSAHFGVISPGFQHSMSKQLLEQVSLVNQKGKTHQETQTTQRSLEVSAEPDQVLTITATQDVFTTRIPFTITFVVDGRATYAHMITASTFTGTTRGTYRISEVLDKHERTFTISGYLSENETSKLKIQFATRPAKPSDCTN